MNKYTGLLLAFFSVQTAVSALPVTFTEAISSKKIRAVVTGNPTKDNPAKSTHTGKCLLLHLTNTTAAKIECKIESAYHFSNLSKSHQDIINAENVLVSLLPNQQKTIAINGFCGEKTNSSPSEKDTFTLDYRHDEKFIQLTAICEKYKKYDHTGQQAIWCFTDRNPISSIFDTGEDTTFENALVASVSNSLGVTPPKRGYAPVRIINYPVEIDTMVAIHVEGITTIGIYLTDHENKIIETLFADETERRSGNAKYTFFYRGMLPKGMYYIKMKKNGAWIIMKEVKVE